MAITLNSLYKKWVGSGPVDVAYLKSVINRDIRAAVAGKIRATPAAVTDWRGDLIAVGKLAKAAHTNPRRTPAKRPRLTPAAIARAHRNPDIHIDIGSHNATRAKRVRTNPNRKRKATPGRSYKVTVTGKTYARFAHTPQGKKLAFEYARAIHHRSPHLKVAVID